MGGDHRTIVLVKCELVNGSRQSQNLLIKSKLVQDATSMRKYTDTGADLGSDVAICLQYNKVNVVRLKHVGEAQACHAPSNDDNLKRGFMHRAVDSLY